MHILILAENLKQANFIQKALIYENLNSDLISFINFDSGSKLIYRYDALLIILPELYNPDLIETFIEHIVNFKPGLPIVVLTQENDHKINNLLNFNKISALFSRPFPFRQIATNIRYLIYDQKEQIAGGCYVLRELELDVNKHLVLYKNTPLFLRNKEFALLQFLMVNKGKVLSRNTILENVWDRNANIFTNTVDVHINQLRNKIEKPSHRKYIHTIPCMGYLFE